MGIVQNLKECCCIFLCNYSLFSFVFVWMVYSRHGPKLNLFPKHQILNQILSMSHTLLFQRYRQYILDWYCCLLILVEEEVLCYMLVVKEEKVLSVGVLKELDMEQYSSEFGSYYFISVCSKFQAGLVIFLSVVVNIK